MKYQFNDVELDTENYQLIKSGQQIKAEPLVINLINYLVVNHDRLISRQELFDNLWSGTIVGENTLSNQINNARKVLGDSGQLQHTIKTIHGRGYQFIANIKQTDSSPTEASKSTLEIMPARFVPRLVVLPLANINVTGEKEYIYVGLNDEIMSSLVACKDIQVIFPNSSIEFKKDGPDIDQLVDQLNANYYIEGNIQRADSRIVFTVKLVDIESRSVIFIDKYELTPSELMGFDSRVAKRVASGILGKLENHEVERTNNISEEQYTAYDYYLRGIHCCHKLNIDPRLYTKKAIEFQEKAIELDPTFAKAIAAKARASSLLYMDDREVVKQAISETNHALTFDESDGTIHCFQGLNYLHLGDYELAEYHYKKAMNLVPSDSNVFARAANFYSYIDESAKAAYAMDINFSLNPAGNSTDDRSRGVYYLINSNYAKALTYFKKLVLKSEDEYAYMAVCATALEDVTSASSYRDLALSYLPSATATYFSIREPFKSKAKLDLFHQLLIKSGFKDN